MNILLVNDDSINAPGIAVLARAAARFGDVWVVAPSSECSAMSQKLTLREKLLLEKVSDFPVPVRGAYRLGGTPVDCVKVALDYILPQKPDLVLSGINNGYNVGYDIAYSGTLGAAFEARRSGIPAMAFSIAANKHLDRVEPWLTDILTQLLEKLLEDDAVWNVNFPPLSSTEAKGILWDRPAAVVSMFREKYVPEPAGPDAVLLTCQGIHTPQEAITPGSDAEAVRGGYISVGKVKIAGR